MRNFILNKLPTTILGYEIHTDFKRWIAVEQLQQNPLNMSMSIIDDVINLVFKNDKPTDKLLAFSEIQAFANMYQEPTLLDDGQEVVFDWEQDDVKVWSAFYKTYGIDLRKADMHFWEFKALMQDLNEDCLLNHAMYYRSVKLSDYEGKQRDDLAKKKKYYEIK